MSILGIIPARKGSKGIPNKNTRCINGKPLIEYTIESALNSKLDRVIVTTDCNIVKGICKTYEVEFVDRPYFLAKDTSLLLPVLQHVLGAVSSYYDAVMTLQPTSPMRQSYHIDDSIDIFYSDSSASSLVSVTKAPHNCIPEKIMTFDGKYLFGKTSIRRRQDVDEYYVRNGAAIYITSKKALLGGCIMSQNILPYFMNKIDSLDIDDMEDWKIVEAIMRCY